MYCCIITTYTIDLWHNNIVLHTPCRAGSSVEPVVWVAWVYVNTICTTIVLCHGWLVAGNIIGTCLQGSSHVIAVSLSLSLTIVIADVWRIGQIRTRATRVRVIEHAMVIQHERKEIKLCHLYRFTRQNYYTFFSWCAMCMCNADELR